MNCAGFRTGVGGRIVEAFDFSAETEIAGLLKISCKTVRRLTENEELPTTEMLLCIHKLTGVSIDWILTGEGDTSFQTSSYVFKKAGRASIASSDNAKQGGLKTG